MNSKPFRSGALPSPSYIAGIGTIGGVGLATLGIQLVQLSTGSEGPYTTLLGTGFPLALSGGLVGTAIWLHRRQTEAVVVRAGRWCLVGIVVLIGVSVWSIAFQHAQGVAMADLLIVTVNHATVGALLGTLVGLYDGQRQEREAALQTEQERANQLSSQLTVLNRILRHDIRNAVNVIRGNVSLLCAGTSDVDRVTETIDAKARELQMAGNRARQLQQLMEQESNRTTPIDIGPILRTKIRTLEGERPESEIESEVPESVEVCAHSWIEVAFEELMENAIEHNDADTPHLDVSVAIEPTGRRTDEAARDVVVRLRDNGPGIPEDEIEALERGYETDLKHLSGLGLWLVYWIVDASGGAIAFEPNDPCGSVVELRLRSPGGTDPG